MELKTPIRLAEMLQQWGLEQVGVLKIQACKVGAGNYLAELKDALTQRGIRVGYLCAPKAEAADLRRIVKVGDRRTVVNPNLPLALLFPPAAISKHVGPFVPETLRLKVIKGNVDIAFPGTRYALPPTSDDTTRAQT